MRSVAIGWTGWCFCLTKSSLSSSWCQWVVSPPFPHLSLELLVSRRRPTSHHWFGPDAVRCEKSCFKLATLFWDWNSQVNVAPEHHLCSAHLVILSSHLFCWKPPTTLFIPTAFQLIISSVACLYFLRPRTQLVQNSGAHWRIQLLVGAKHFDFATWWLLVQWCTCHFSGELLTNSKHAKWEFEERSHVQVIGLARTKTSPLIKCHEESFFGGQPSLMTVVIISTGRLHIWWALTTKRGQWGL